MGLGFGLGAGIAADVGIDAAAVGSVGLGAEAAGAVGLSAADAGLTAGAIGAAGLGADAAGTALAGGDIAAGAAGVDAAADLGAGAAGIGAAGADAAGLAAPSISAGVTDAGAAAGSVGAGTTASAIGAAPIATAGPSAASVGGLPGVAAAGGGDLASAVPATSELAGVDQSALASQTALGASGGTNSTGLVAEASGDVGGGASAAPASIGGDAGGTASTIGAVPVTGDATPTGLIDVPPAPPGGVGAVDPATGNVIQPSALSQIGDAASNTWDKISGVVNSPTGKTLGVGLAGIGLAKDLLAPSTPKGLNAIASEASAAQAQGQVLQNYLATGTLPPAVQTSINAATKNGITAIKAKYASMGVAPGSSAEVNDINQLQQNAVIQGATLADQLLQQGISETQLSAQLYNDLVSTNTAQNTQTGSAISSLASALAGGGNTIKIQGATAA